MCSGKAPKTPAPAPPPPEMQDAGVIGARDAERMRRRLASSNTILTGPLGTTTQAPLQTKSLLGQ